MGEVVSSAPTTPSKGGTNDGAATSDSGKLKRWAAKPLMDRFLDQDTQASRAVIAQLDPGAASRPANNANHEDRGRRHHEMSKPAAGVSKRSASASATNTAQVPLRAMHTLRKGAPVQYSTAAPFATDN